MTKKLFNKVVKSLLQKAMKPGSKPESKLKNKKGIVNYVFPHEHKDQREEGWEQQVGQWTWDMGQKQRWCSKVGAPCHNEDAEDVVRYLRVR